MKSDNKAEKHAISVVFEPDLIEQMDERVKALDLNRSQYLRRLAREDLAKHPKMEIEVAA